MRHTFATENGFFPKANAPFLSQPFGPPSQKQTPERLERRPSSASMDFHSPSATGGQHNMSDGDAPLRAEGGRQGRAAEGEAGNNSLLIFSNKDLEQRHLHRRRRHARQTRRTGGDNAHPNKTPSSTPNVSHMTARRPSSCKCYPRLHTQTKR